MQICMLFEITLLYSGPVILMLHNNLWYLLYVTVSAKTRHVCTKIYIHFFGPAFSYTQ